MIGRLSISKEKPEVGDVWGDVIGNNGTATYRFEGDFENYIFLAEYPTWQEAVNSKEFNGEEK